MRGSIKSRTPGSYTLIASYKDADGKRRQVWRTYQCNKKEAEQKLRERVYGYLPITIINPDREDKGNRIASTIRHNRARGKHIVAGMSDIVLELKRRNWSDAKIGRELGMEPDEVLRLAQITGLAEMFADREFSEAWEANDGEG
jgi:ParB-like chromosome segregation protein Spo0J